MGNFRGRRFRWRRRRRGFIEVERWNRRQRLCFLCVIRECCGVSSQEGSSIRWCLFGAYFDRGIVPNGAGFFRALKMSSGDGPNRDYCGECVFGDFEGKRREDFLRLRWRWQHSKLSGSEFLGGEMTRLAAETCATQGGGVEFVRRRHCWVGFGGEKRCVERVLFPCVGHNL